MPFARDLLDVLVVPADPQAAIDAEQIGALFDRWQQAGLLGPGTGPLRRTAGPRAWGLLAGGFGTLWLDRPERMALYANQLGGFRIHCPDCGAALALAFGRAVESWRRGGDPLLRCPFCGASRPVWSVPLAPRGAFARGAVIFGDAAGRGPEALEPTATAQHELSLVMGPIEILLRRRA